MVVNMYRYFISQYPTFGSYKKPKPYLVEASPYFWWWYALTLNETYAHLCELKESETLLTESETDFPEAMLQVYEDFGDVRHEGCRYRSFAKWWRERVNTGETRGEYLFAESPHVGKVKELTSISEAEEYLADDSFLLISIPLDRQRQHIDKALDKILKKRLKAVKGRAARDLIKCTARYCLSKPLTAGSLKKTFDVYSIKIGLGSVGRVEYNYEIFDKAGLKLNEKSEGFDEIKDEQATRRTKSVVVSRYVRSANSLIGSAGVGLFPSVV